MGNCRLYKAESFHMLGMPESERLKVTALNLFHPTAPPLSRELVLSYYDTVSCGRRLGVCKIIFGVHYLFWDRSNRTETDL